MDAMTLQAPFPAFGGKSKIAHVVWQRFGEPANFVEPFANSAAVLLKRPGWTERVNWIETINDADGFISNFWRAVAADPEQVAHYADWPVNENDLTARHAWLVRNHLGSLATKLEGDPDFYDAKIAGWWVWGACCWIGSGWCSGVGPWQQVDGELVAVGGRGVKRARPALGDAGRGVNRQLVHLGDAGQGVNRQRPHLGDAGQGVNRKRPADPDGLIAWMQALSARLRRVRVACGDWSRVCGPSPTTKLGLTAVFLDPPYSDLANRDPGLYAVDSLDVAHEARAWAIANGDNPQMRIALCGYDGEHAMPEGWTSYRWKAHGGFGSQGDENGNGRANAAREVVWFSPYCLADGRHEQQALW